MLPLECKASSRVKECVSNTIRNISKFSSYLSLVLAVKSFATIQMNKFSYYYFFSSAEKSFRFFVSHEVELFFDLSSSFGWTGKLHVCIKQPSVTMIKCLCQGQLLGDHRLFTFCIEFSLRNKTCVKGFFHNTLETVLKIRNFFVWCWLATQEEFSVLGELILYASLNFMSLFRDHRENFPFSTTQHERRVKMRTKNVYSFLPLSLLFILPQKFKTSSSPSTFFLLELQCWWFSRKYLNIFLFIFIFHRPNCVRLSSAFIRCHAFMNIIIGDGRVLENVCHI